MFEGLKIMSLEKEWTQYPVLHLDLSVAKGQDSAKDLRETLMWMMRPLSEVYGRKDDETTPGKLLTGLIHRAQEMTGRQVAVIIDEYDAQFLQSLERLRAIAPICVPDGHHEVLAAQHLQRAEQYHQREHG